MFFKLIFCGENGYDDISIIVIHLDHVLNFASSVLNNCPKQEISLFTFVDGMLIDENKYLVTLPDWTPLTVCKPDQKEDLFIYFNLKRTIEARC